MPISAVVLSSSGLRGRDGVSRAGYRTIVLFRKGERAVFIYGFAKSERANMNAGEEEQFKEAARHVLRLTEEQLSQLLKTGDFVEIEGNEQEISK